MPTITDHLEQSRAHQQHADAEPSHHYRQVVSYLLCALENLTEAVDQLHQQVNALRAKAKEKSSMTTIETKTAFAAQVPDQSFADLLRTLHEPIAVNLIKSREGWTDFSGHKQMVDYVEWHTVADILDRQAPTWQHTIRQITQMRETVIVIAALTIEGVTREGIGTGPANTETGIKKAEHDALKRAAIKFGIARELYQHDRAHGGQQPQQAQPMPTHPVAQSTSDLATPKQLGLIQPTLPRIGTGCRAGITGNTEA